MVKGTRISFKNPHHAVLAGMRGYRNEASSHLELMPSTRTQQSVTSPPLTHTMNGGQASLAHSRLHVRHELGMSDHQQGAVARPSAGIADFPVIELAILDAHPGFDSDDRGSF